MSAEARQLLHRHATSVAIDGKAVLIEGPSGSGKSGFALELIAFGARLISDDMTRVEARGEGWPYAVSAGRMDGVIEARGVGLIQVPYTQNAPITLIVDMGRQETERLPVTRTTELMNTEISTVSRVDSPHFAAAILALVKGGRVA